MRKIVVFAVMMAFALSANAKQKAKSIPDLVAVKGGSPAQMFEAGIKEFGGMSHFIKKGQTVLVKPNIGWNKLPTEAANTSPELVGKIVKMAVQAGAKEVRVFDHTCNEWTACYKNSGIEKAVKKNGGKMYRGNEESDYRPVTIKGAKILKTSKVHKLYLDSDVIINVPILKHHSGTGMSSALKNLMGVVWDRRKWHRDGLHQCIADFPLVKKKVNLHVIDAYNVMIRGGPRGLTTDDLRLKKMQILSKDGVLADSAASGILGLKPKDTDYLIYAEKHGYGSTNLKKKNIKKITLK